MKACGLKRTYIVDCRSYWAATGNMFNGGGTESLENYRNCDLEFMNIPNIHAVRDSLAEIRTILSTETNIER